MKSQSTNNISSSNNTITPPITDPIYNILESWAPEYKEKDGDNNQKVLRQRKEEEQLKNCDKQSCSINLQNERLANSYLQYRVSNEDQFCQSVLLYKNADKNLYDGRHVKGQSYRSLQQYTNQTWPQKYPSFSNQEHLEEGMAYTYQKKDNFINFLSFVGNSRAVTALSLDYPIKKTYEKAYFPTTMCRTLPPMKLERNLSSQIDNEAEQIQNLITNINVAGSKNSLSFRQQKQHTHLMKLYKIQEQQQSLRQTVKCQAIKAQSFTHNKKQLAIYIEQQQRPPYQSFEQMKNQLAEMRIDDLKLIRSPKTTRNNYINSSIYSTLEQIKLSKQYVTLNNKHSYSPKNNIEQSYNSNQDANVSRDQNRQKAIKQSNRKSLSPVSYETQRKFQKIPYFGFLEEKQQIAIGNNQKTIKDKRHLQKYKSSYKKDIMLRKNRDSIIEQDRSPVVKLFGSKQKDASREKKGKITLMQRFNFNKKPNTLHTPQDNPNSSYFIKISPEKQKELSKNKSLQKQKIRMTLKQSFN